MLKRLSPRQPFYFPVDKKPADFRQRGNDEKGAGETQNRARRRARQVRVFPDSEKSERPVDAHWSYRQKKPETRKGLGGVQRAKKRIRAQAEQKSEIKPETARADGERKSERVKGTLRDLVTEIAEKRVKRAGKIRRIIRLRQRRGND